MKPIQIPFRNYMLPDTREDSAAAFRKLSEHLAQLPNDTPVTISFEPGRYDFYEEGAFERVCYISNHTQTHRKKIALLIENRRNVTLDGYGAEFLFHGTLIPAAFIRTEQCVLKNFSIDYEYPQLHQLVIREEDESRNELVCEIFPREDYRIEEGNKLYFLHENNPDYLMESVMPFEENGRLCWNKADLPFQPEKISEISPGKLRLAGWNPRLKTGCRMVLRPVGRPAPGIFLYHADRTRIEQVAVHYAFGMGLLAQMTEDITLNGAEKMIPDSSPRRPTPLTSPAAKDGSFPKTVFTKAWRMTPSTFTGPISVF